MKKRSGEKGQLIGGRMDTWYINGIRSHIMNNRGIDRRWWTIRYYPKNLMTKYFFVIREKPSIQTMDYSWNFSFLIRRSTSHPGNLPNNYHHRSEILKISRMHHRGWSGHRSVSMSDSIEILGWLPIGYPKKNVIKKIFVLRLEKNPQYKQWITYGTSLFNT